MNVYDFTVKNAQGEDVSLSKFKGKVSLIVNTASQCGYAVQFPELEKLYKKHEAAGLVVMSFPCSQFLNQEPGTNDEIQKLYHDEYGLTFPIFAKINVNGNEADPLYKHLKKEKPFDVKTDVPEEMQKLYIDMDPEYLNSAEIKWNFTKFLVDKSGNVVARYEPEDEPMAIEKFIEAIL